MRNPPLLTICQSSGRYLRYADVCAFHHYPAWHPANEPGNMDEVKQVPLIWEAVHAADKQHSPCLAWVSTLSTVAVARLAK